MNAPAQSSLVCGYFAQREALSRFFRARAGPSADVEDLLQDLYLKVISVDPATEVREVNALLYRLASNLMMDRWRSARRGAARDGAWHQISVSAGPGADVADLPTGEAIVIGRERLHLLLKAMDRLPEKTQRIFRMHKFEGRSYAEIALSLEVSRSSVEKHMMDALRVLSKAVPK